MSKGGETENYNRGRSEDGDRLRGRKEKLEDFNAEEVRGMDRVFGGVVRFE